MSPNAPTSTTLTSDDRGAIMVMGIFMCVFLVGALWYIAGVGDAILYRERMQEASDAVAFSTAILEARGMNILVLLNLVMAAIEAILVAINLIMFATLATIAVLTALALALSWCGAGEALGELAAELANVYEQEKNLHDEVKPVIDDALQAIHGVESGIPAAVPPVAQLASYEVASTYQPTINAAEGTFTVFMQEGVPLAGVQLPVKTGTTHKLCMKAFDAVEGAMNQVVGGLGSVLDPVKSLIDGVGASDFFCELGGGGSAPDLSSKLSDLGNSQCSANQTIQAQCKTASDEQTSADQLTNKCGNWSPDATPPTAPPDPQCPNLGAMQAQASADQDKCNKMQKSCQDNVQKGVSKAQSQQSSQANGDGSGKEPSAVDHQNWCNGSDKAQILAIENGSGGATTYSPKFVTIASQGRVSAADPTVAKGQTLSASQAEFFYDCTGSWDSCDNDEEALWNFHWRARLRMTNPNVFGPFGAALYAVEGRFGVQVASDAAQSPAVWSSGSPARVQLAKDLANLAPPLTMSLH
jgi:hypothetical protein